MIERDPSIRFHEEGTLNAVTRWIASHDEGIAEWLKNVRRAYQADRANVVEKHRAAVLLIKDGTGGDPARLGLLDVGGATLEDVTAWSTWQDPSASGRDSGLPEEETQGNGGKTYMYACTAARRRFWAFATASTMPKDSKEALGRLTGEPLASSRMWRLAVKRRSLRWLLNLRVCSRPMD